MKCTRFCGPRISLRRALFLAAAQIILALIIANSSGPERTDDAAGKDLDGQVVSPVGAD